MKRIRDFQLISKDILFASHHVYHHCLYLAPVEDPLHNGCSLSIIEAKYSTIDHRVYLFVIGLQNQCQEMMQNKVVFGRRQIGHMIIMQNF